MALSSSAVVSDAFFVNNRAVGGAGGSGAAGGDGGGGAIANGGGFESGSIQVFGLPPDASSLALANSTLICNLAQGGAGGAGGSNGGSGLGGGCYVLGTTTASIDATQIVANAALGSATGCGRTSTSGQGVGGGLYIDTGADVTLSPSIEVDCNFASTSNDNIFGTYTVS